MSIADGELTSMALCWRLERTDGAGIALTSHDRPLERDGVTSGPAPGMIPASVTRRLGLEPNSSELAGRAVAATVVALGDGELTLDQSLDDRFVLGRLRYMSGANCGLSTVVLSVSGPIVRVRDLPRAVIDAGCRVELREGCDKRF